MNKRDNAILSGQEWDQLSLVRASKLVPRPTKLADTGLSQTFVADLVAKQLLDRGTLSLVELSSIVALAGSIIESVLNFMRDEALIEVRPGKASATGPTPLPVKGCDQSRSPSRLRQ